MIFRNANNNDANKLDELLTKLIEDECQYDKNCKAIKVKDFYIHYILDPTKYFYLCEDDNKIVGYIYAIIENNNIKIDALYVEEDKRRLGIASKLINNVINYAHEKKFNKVVINVLSNNIKAKNLYYKYFKLNKKIDDNKEELLLEISK